MMLFQTLQIEDKKPFGLYPMMMVTPLESTSFAVDTQAKPQILVARRVIGRWLRWRMRGPVMTPVRLSCYVDAADGQ